MIVLDNTQATFSFVENPNHIINTGSLNELGNQKIITQPSITSLPKTGERLGGTLFISFLGVVLLTILLIKGFCCSNLKDDK